MVIKQVKNSLFTIGLIAGLLCLATVARAEFAVAPTPSYQFSSTSPIVSSVSSGIGSSRMGYSRSIQPISVQNGRKMRRSVSGGNILGNSSGIASRAMNRAEGMAQAPFVEMRSTSVMLGSSSSSTGSISAASISSPLRVGRYPGTPDDDEEEEGEQQPIGDALLPLLLMAIAFTLYKTRTLWKKD